jgi:hypothetical protein
LAATEHVRVVRFAASALAATMRPGDPADDAGRIALLTPALAALAKRSSPGGLLDLIKLIETGIEDTDGTRDDEQLRQRVIEDLAALLGNANVFMPGAEPLNAATRIAAG